MNPPDRSRGQVFAPLTDRHRGQDPTPRTNTGRTGTADRCGQEPRTKSDRGGCVPKDTPWPTLTVAVGTRRSRT